MKRYFLFLLAIVFVVACTQSRPVKTCDTFTEAADPALGIPAEWSKVSPKLNVSFGTIDTRYAKSSVPVAEKVTGWTGSGWRGERVSAQVVLWSSAGIEQVECEFTPFVSETGVLDAGIAQARFVRYVLTDIFDPGCGYRKPENFPVSLSPDMLDTLSCFHLEANTTRPVWLTFDIPSDAKPGIYTGTLNIYARKQKSQKLHISLEVLPQTLPPVKEWKFHLDLWQNPSAVARIYGVKPWSEAHWQLLENQMKMLAGAGQKVITATVNKDPWNVQCYDAFESMITWTKNKDGSWTYDFSVFDRWVEFMMRLGVTKMINCYSMIPWNNELRYYDAASGAQIDVSAKPGSKAFVELWTPFLVDFRKHLNEKGWLNITNIAMDERAPQDMKAMLDLLQKVAPEFGVSLADNHKSYKQYPYLKDICVAFGATFDESDLAFRKLNGLISTYYVCCADRFPNVFTFSDPAEGAYIAWYATAAGLDGFLRWAYNSWVENPVMDSRFRAWPAGDTYITYPGGRSSIRFERLREGIQDAEKIRILREQFTLSANSDASAKLAKLNKEIAKFNIPAIPSIPCREMLQSGKKVLEELSKGKEATRYGHVVVIGIDGLTSEGLMQAETPVLDDLIAHGAFKSDVRTVLPTVSAPNWSAMIHGAGPEATGMTSNDFKKWMQPIDKSRNGMFPNIFNIIREQLPGAEQGAIYHWDGFGRLFQKETVNRADTYNSPEETTRQVCDYITAKKPVFLFVQLDHVDGAGHGFGYKSPEYLKAVTQADSLVGFIMKSIQQAGIANNTLVMIVSDHGGFNKGHGGESADEINVPIIYYGKSVKKNYKIQQTVYMYDVAANVAFALNLNMPHAWTGRPTLSAFEGYFELQ